MKSKRLKKNVFVALSCASMIFLMASCSSDQKISNTKELKQQNVKESFDEKNQEKDAKFLSKASEMNIAEIQMGQLAQKKGSEAHIRMLGKMMEDAHTQSQKDLIALAKSKGITVPTTTTKDAQDVYNSLDKKSGKEFDKAYAELMVSGHEKTISTFEKASNDTKDNDVRNWATASLTDLRKHHEHAVESKKKCDKV